MNYSSFTKQMMGLKIKRLCMNKLFLLAALAVIAPTAQAAQNSESQDSVAHAINTANKHFEKAHYLGELNASTSLAVLATWLAKKVPFCGRLAPVVIASAVADAAFTVTWVGFHHHKTKTRLEIQKTGLQL
jgi:hypothetical protein